MEKTPENLTFPEAAALGKIQARIASVYGAESDWEKRKAVQENLELIDMLYQEVKENPTSEKAIKNIDEMVAFLTSLDKESGFISNIEMLAAERLMKLCQYIEDPVLVRHIIDAIISRASASSIDAERAYYLGLIYHFTSQSNYSKIEEHLSATQITGGQDNLSPTSLYRPDSEGFLAMANGIPKFRKVVAEIIERNLHDQGEAQSKSQMEIYKRYARTLRMVNNDFQEQEGMDEETLDEINTARLLARYYEQDYERPAPKYGTNPDILLRNLDAEKDIKNTEEVAHEDLEDGVQNGYYLWALRAGYHPKQDKIDHAKQIGDPLTRFKIVNKSEYESDDKPDYSNIGEVPPVTDSLGEVYYQLLRSAKDAENSQAVERLRGELTEIIWGHMCANDNSIPSQFGGPENILVLAYTHRDKIERDGLGEEENDEQESPI